MGYKKWTASAKTLKPDARFESKLAGKFINCLMWDGKKHAATRVFYGAMDIVAKKITDTPLVEVFDLPGIPWNLFFDLSGTAIHGAYWHNDFGIKRSHGCLNISCEAARWIYRWAYPIGGYEDDFIQSDYRVGTPISIF